MKTVGSVLLFVLFLFSFSLRSQEDDIVKYINNWKDVAVNQMVLHGVPASITMAQAILESGHGKSKLAIKANNHFGIKCNGWKGATFYHDDDLPNECFRKYASASVSFEDHSIFLTGRARYASLFDLEITDYKSWARGLKAAGYATNPIYHKLLIEIIERYDLDKLDDEGNIDWVATNSENVKANRGEVAQTNKGKHKIYYNPNKTKYVIAGQHDTFYQISSEFGVSLRQLNRWNDFPQTKDLLHKGDKIYIMRKRKRPASNEVRVEINESKPLWEVSQEYGIQLKTLVKINNFSSPDVAIQEGDIVFLK